MKDFLSASELKISEAARTALIKALDYMQSNKIEHVSSANEAVDSVEKGVLELRPYYFNMDYWGTVHECGTVCCIGGLSELLSSEPIKMSDEIYGVMGVDVYKVENYNEALDDLFHPEFSHDWKEITLEQAIQALTNYLTTGKATWDVVLG